MKIFTNYIFRNILLLVVFAATIFCPLYFMLPKLATSEQIILGIAVLLFAVIEGIGIVFINYKLLLSPLKKVNTTAKKLCNGAYHVQTDIKIGDEEVKQLGKNIDNISNEFDNLEQMRKSFVANASHELRSPLTSMQGFLQAVLDGTIEKEDSEKYLKIVLNETKRLNSLITSMLDLSRIESGKYPLTKTRFELNTVVRGVAERFKSNLEKKELQLDIDFARTACYVYADKEKIIQVLINLIDNAIKYSPAYSRILLNTRVNSDKVLVTVKDQGLGIGKKDQLLIWDKFYMADKARTPNKSKGTGLGLSIVKKIIDEHQEHVWVESNKGAGATFGFSLAIFDADKHKTDSGTLQKEAIPKSEFSS